MKKKATDAMAPDVRLERHGTIHLLVPLTRAGKEWLHTHLAIEPWQITGEAVAVEPRYSAPILTAAVEDGLVADLGGLSVVSV